MGDVDINIINDATEEEEDIVGKELDIDNTSVSAPNNDFCFTEADFTLTNNAKNEVERHQAKHSMAWEEIKSLKGEEILCGSGDNKIVWKVVEGVYDDEMGLVIKQEKQKYDDGGLSLMVGDMPTSFISCFMKMWPVNFWEDLRRLNDAITVNNVERKKNFQKPIKRVNKYEYLRFLALLIAASQHSKQGTRLWKSGNDKKLEGFSKTVDFSDYMKEWRFKQLQQLIPEVMFDPSKKEEDDWWKFSTRVQNFNEVRHWKTKLSSVRVLDESMSFFIPR